MGYTEFISGMADGVDLDFAEYVLYLKNHEEFDIKLEAALPYAAKPTKRPTHIEKEKMISCLIATVLFPCLPLITKAVCKSAIVTWLISLTWLLQFGTERKRAALGIQ